MEKEFWLTKWQKNDIAFNQLEPNSLLLQFFSQLNLKIGSRILVPLCGKSIDMLWLKQQGFHVIGVELSFDACQQFFSENNISYHQEEVGSFKALMSDSITLLSGDFFMLDNAILGQFKAIYDRAALVALPKEIRQKYAKKIISLSAPSTQMLVIAASYDQASMQGPPFSVDEAEIQTLYSSHFKIKRLYKESAKIAEHLKAKGLKEASEIVFHLLKAI